MMHISSLKQKVLENRDKQDIIQDMKNISGFEPKPESLKELYSCKCLPVKLPSGEVRWLDKSGEFLIQDRREYGEIFRNKASFLDFTLEEAHSLKLLLVGMGLEKRYTSNAVRETTAVQDGSFNPCLTKDLRRKAYAICR